MAEAGLADFAVARADGSRLDLGEKLGKVLLVVNTASQCGFTPQYSGLEALWQRFGARGFEVLAFPCNQFGAQEPGDAAQIAQFCQVNFGLSFPVLGKVKVNGGGADPFWRWLTGQAGGVLGSRAVKWNFTKFLIGREGQVVGRFAPMVPPAWLAGRIERLL